MQGPRRCFARLALLAVLASGACTDDPDPASRPSAVAPEMAAARSARTMVVTTNRAVEQRIESSLRELAAAADMGGRTGRNDVALHGVWWTGRVDDRTMGGFVYFSHRGNKQLPFQWVPGDERRNGRTDIGYAVGVPLPGAFPIAAPGVGAGDVEAAIDRAMATWADQRCSRRLEVTKGTFFDWIVFDSDILHAGFRPLDPGVIGVTLPYIFVDENGDPTDVNNDGAADFAFAEIYYNSNLLWGIGSGLDVETIALHEAGHGLGQAHFGAAFETLANGKIHFSPRSVMNAAYSGVQQSLTGTDIGGHCGLFGSWPNR